MSYNLSSSIDYVNQKIYVTISSDSAGMSAASIDTMRVVAVNSKGVLVSTPTGFSPSNTLNGTDYLTASASLSFGIPVRGDALRQPADTFMFNSDMVHAYDIYSGLSIKTGLYTPIVNTPMNIPLVIEDGESVLRGKILSVSGKNLITFTGASENMLTALTTDFAGYKLEFVTGAYSGMRTTVVSSAASSRQLYVDADMRSMSGLKFKLMPVMNVTGNSSWDTTSVISRLYTDTAMPTGLGHVSLDSVSVISYIATGSTSGFPWNYNAYVKNQTSYGGAVFQITKDTTWYRYPEVGDILYYRTAADSANMNGRAVVYAVNNTGSAVNSYIFVYPSGTPSNLEGFTDAILYRRNRGRMLSYPGFGETLNLIAYDVSTGPIASASILTPEASIEITANDYDSAYSTIGNVSHFHIGPIIVGNGQVIDSRELTFSGSIYNSNPTQVTPDASWVGYGTMTGSASEYLTGNYYRKGAFANTYSQAFISSEMLTLSAKIRYGSAEVKSVLSLPVQPSA